MQTTLSSNFAEQLCSDYQTILTQTPLLRLSFKASNFTASDYQTTLPEIVSEAKRLRVAQACGPAPLGSSRQPAAAVYMPAHALRLEFCPVRRFVFWIYTNIGKQQKPLTSQICGIVSGLMVADTLRRWTMPFLKEK